MTTEDASREPVCKRDTNGDGDCHRCASSSGCPMGIFRRCHIERAMMTDEQVREFKRTAEKFEYTEAWLGTVRGWRNHDQVLIEQVEPA